jgi:hypothetical protein
MNAVALTLKPTRMCAYYRFSQKKRKTSLVETKYALDFNHCRVKQEANVLIPGIYFR